MVKEGKKGLISMAIGGAIVGGILVLGLSTFFGVNDSNVTLGGFTVTPDAEGEISDEQVLQITEALGNIILLPMEEEPLVAFVEDAASLRIEQPFYKDVENGDVLVIYPTMSRAMIYRTSKNMLVNVGPVQVDSNTEEDVQAVQSPQEATP